QIRHIDRVSPYRLVFCSTGGVAMSAAKIISVVGATGATAGGLARAILSHPDDGYACRAITRDPGSAAARALSEQGATVVQADLDDYDSLVRAFDGADAAFCM